MVSGTFLRYFVMRLGIGLSIRKNITIYRIFRCTSGDGAKGLFSKHRILCKIALCWLVLANRLNLHTDLNCVQVVSPSLTTFFQCTVPLQRGWVMYNTKKIVKFFTCSCKLLVVPLHLLYRIGKQKLTSWSEGKNDVAVERCASFT